MSQFLSNSYSLPGFKPIRRGFFFDRAVQRAFVYSILAHALFLGLFHIKELKVHAAKEDPYISSLIIEAIDPILVADAHANSVPIIPVSEEPLEQTLYKESIASLEGPLSFHSPSLPPSTYYPLHIHLSGNLRNLVLVEDGALLFKRKNGRSLQASQIPSTSYTITYTVQVSGKTGTITMWKRKKELLDKELQLFADSFLSHIAFLPFEGIIEGKLRLTFYCDSATLKELVQ